MIPPWIKGNYCGQIHRSRVKWGRGKWEVLVKMHKVLVNKFWRSIVLKIKKKKAPGHRATP